MSKRILKIVPKEDIDLGLAISHATLPPGQTRTYREIAAYCGCGWQTIWEIENRAKRKLRKRLAYREDGNLRELVEQIIGRPVR